MFFVGVINSDINVYNGYGCFCLFDWFSEVLDFVFSDMWVKINC